MLARVAAAQTTDAAIVGAARDGAGRPLAGVEVTARDAATGFRTATRTDAAGQFSLLQLPLGGPYAVTLRALGYRAVTRAGYQLALGARVRVDVALAPAVAALTPVRVEAARDADRRAQIGGNYRVGAAEIAAVPAVNRSFTDLASLAPTAGPQNGLLGQRWTSTDVRIDGAQARNLFRAGEAGAGPYTISLEAVREFQVTAADYDVTQGRQGGGAIRAATKAGTNTTEGSVFAYRRGSDLSASTDYQGRGRDLRQFTTTQFGGSVGGPIVRDRLHYFAAFDRQEGSSPLVSGVLNTSGDQIAAGVARDSVTRLLQILRSTYGLNPTQPQLGRLARRPGATTGFGRLDWELSARHHLTLRSNLDWWDNPLSGGVDQALTLYEARSDFASHEQQHVAALRSTFDHAVGGPLENDLTLGLNTARRTLTPVSGELPRGFVRIQSTLPDGTKGDTRIQFGGNRLAPDDSREREWQLLDVAHAQRGPVLFTAGTDNTLTRTETFIGESQSGLFEFQSLADLAAERPFRYSRTVPLGGSTGPSTAQSVLELGAFVQGEWRPAAAADRLSVTAGLRWDGTAFLTRPAYDPAVDQAFGVRTDRRPSDFTKVEPRGQVVWDVVGTGRDVVRVGGGRFAAQLPYYLEHNQLQNTGLTLADVALTGTAVPTPDFAAYRANPATIPGVPAGAAAPPSYVNVVAPGFRTPSVWKASAAYQRRVAEWLTLTGTVLGSRTTQNYTYYDLNLRPTAAFTLDNEGGRGVFVPASTIIAAGVTQNSNAWVTRAVGRTLELRSDGAAREAAGVVEAAVRLARGAALDVSYTRNRSRDNSSYGCCLARTMTTYTPVPSDPRDLSGSWGPSDVDFKHKVVVAGTLPALAGFRVSGRYVGSTGRPFSAVVNGDLNGDEANGNDLAFVFNPDDPTTPADVATSMRKVLNNPGNVARDYLRANLGRVATRNGATVPWTGRVDLRLARSIATARGPRVQLTADVFNAANLLNRRWGAQDVLPAGISDQNPVTQRVPLLNVVGFDQATRRYKYTVNENFGVLTRGGDPYQIQLGARYAF
ncbi:Oar protein [Gemmatimonadetes bacterium T265]|nr:Oar protein [Gemmatimonadetes bacterium T265]